MEWVLIEKVGTSPVRRTYTLYDYQSNKRINIFIDEWIYYDISNNIHYFSSKPYVVRYKGKVYRFGNLSELNSWLTEKGFPPK